MSDYMHEANAIAARLRRGGAGGVGATVAGAAAGTSAGLRRAGRPRLRGASPMALRVLAFVRQFFADNDQLPPAVAVAAEFGWVSTQSAFDHLRALERFGYIERNAVGKWRFARAHVPAVPAVPAVPVVRVGGVK